MSTECKKLYGVYAPDGKVITHFELFNHRNTLYGYCTHGAWGCGINKDGVGKPLRESHKLLTHFTTSDTYKDTLDDCEDVVVLTKQSFIDALSRVTYK